MIDVKRQIAVLELFNEKAAKLMRLSFIKALSEPNTGASIKGKQIDDETFEIKAERRGPSEEAIDAFVLTFRFFIQDNERSSFRNIATVYESENIDPEFRKRFHSARQAINQLLDAPNSLNLSYNNNKPSNGEIMDVFIYGGLAHANLEKYEKYKEWIGFPIVASILETCFTLVLGRILQAVNYISILNQDVIKELNQKGNLP